MKRVIIDIKGCGDCPHFRFDPEVLDEWCVEAGRELKSVDLPTWCPLPEAPETEEE